MRGTTVWMLEAALIALLVFSPGNVNGADHSERERAFTRALELFDAAKSPEDYRESARTFESVLSGGFQNGAVYYNLGNAWYRAGEYGRAILNYRKAQLFRPRDSYLNANLEQALATAPGRLAAPPRAWWNHVLFWNQWLSYPLKWRMFFVGWMLLAIVTSAAVVLRITRLTIPLIGAVLILCLLGIDCWVTDQQVNHSRRAVITGETVARKGIGESYEPAFDQPLRDGAEFEILAVTTDWTFGHFESVGDGWVRNEFVAR